MDVGNQIKKLRRERHWTQAQLAELVGIDKRNICRYEKGHAEPRKSTLLKLSEIFEVGLEELMGFPASSTDVCEDTELQTLVNQMIKLPEKDREALKHIMKAVIQKNQASAALAS